MSHTALKTDPIHGTDFVLRLDALIRSIGIQRTRPVALFLGAGASVSSGVPSAQKCIWEWKRQIFLTNNPGLEAQFAELSLIGVQRQIQTWLDAQGGYPAEGSEEEYGYYIAQCFPIADDRRAFFQEKIRSAKPHAGYHLLSHLAGAGLVRSVWSTNFDSLTARAAAQYPITPIEVGIDCQDRAIRPVGANELLCVSLHGDYRYDALKNTPDELQRQEQSLRQSLISEIADTSLIVCGYSGRDRSIMESLAEGYSTSGAGTLYWCGYGDSDLPPAVRALIRHARDHGREAFYTPGQGFDDLGVRLASHCLESEAREAAKSVIAGMAEEDLGARKPFEVTKPNSSVLIKSNAFEVKCPQEVLSFDLREWPEEKVWRAFRDLTDGTDVRAVPHKGKVLAIGLPDSVAELFDENIEGEIERVPVGPNDLRYEDGHVVSLFMDAIVSSMAARAKLPHDGRREIWLKNSLKTIKSGQVTHTAYESVRLSLRQIGNAQYLVMLPSIRVLGPDCQPSPREIAEPLRLGILGYQHNDKFNKAVNDWRKKLFKEAGEVTFEYPIGSASSFKFKIRSAPILAEIGSARVQRRVQLPNRIRSSLKHTGLSLREPRLLFGSANPSTPKTDTHPIRGLVNNRPYDFALTQKGLASHIRLGVISPGQDISALSAYLQNSRQVLKPGKSEQDYLLEYRGFHEAFGLSLDVPAPDDPGWSVCQEPETVSVEEGAREIARNITRSIDALHAALAPSVILIYFPARWDDMRGYRTDKERFDVHDFVKAYCVQRGIATQFLNQDTVIGDYQCRVWWWLSLALYVKAMRTPFVLEHLAQDTAFIGLGYSVDHAAETGRHIVMGCSHIYSARGEGLQYRLSQIEDPVRRGRNVFLSREDARRTGEQIRELFFDARSALPRRVVLHKRLPFLKEEREGFLEGLGGVESVDMLEIQIDSALRYVASKPAAQEVDRFPVRRGTVLKLDDFTALLWGHGSAEALNPRFSYYQGKRRIPSPLVLRRYAGATDLAKLGTEILGLTKMNWNTFDLYSKMPATLHSSNEIARIGNLLEHIGAASFDYRLFM